MDIDYMLDENILKDDNSNLVLLKYFWTDVYSSASKHWINEIWETTYFVT